MTREQEAVFWDLGGVILDGASVVEGRELFIDLLSEEYGVETEYAHETWRTELSDYFDSRDGQSFRAARDGYQQTLEQILERELSPEDWLPIMKTAASRAFRPVDGTLETIRAVDEAGLYVGLASDIDTWEAEFILSMFDVRQHFDALTTSEEVGRTKPDPRMFETAVTKAGIDPQQGIHVGDRYRHDMVGATQANLQTAAYAGSAAEEATVTDGGIADPAVDYVLEEIPDLLDILEVE